MKIRKASASYFRNFIFGVEDSLVSTVGLLSGIAVADMPPRMIPITGAVLIFVEAFSMGVGSFLSERSEEDYVKHTETKDRKPLIASGIMFLSYLIAGFIPLFPYLVFSIEEAFLASITLSFIALFFLGILGGKISRIHVFHSGMRMLILGGIAIVVGVTVGRLIGAK